MLNWFLTDPDNHQYIKKINDHTFHLIELNLISHNPEKFEVYEDTIDVYDYLQNNGKEGFEELKNILNSFGYYIGDNKDLSLKNIILVYPLIYKQIIAECIFEYYGSFQANQLKINLSLEEAINCINNFIENN